MSGFSHQSSRNLRQRAGDRRGAAQPSDSAPVQLLAAMVESSDEAIVGKSLEGTILTWNRGAEELYGYTALEAVGQPISLLLPPESKSELAEIFQHLARGEHIARYETVRLRKDGTRIDVSVAISPIRDGSGNLIGASSTAHSIANHKQTKEQLRESEERFRAAFQGAAVGMGRVSFSDACWIDANDALCRMVGYSQAEMRVTPWPKITHPDDVDLDLIPFRRLAVGDINSYTVEKRFIHKQGHVVWARLTLSLARDAQGRPDYEIAVVEDITARKQAETRLQRLYDAGIVGIMSWKANGAITEANDKFLQMTGYTRQDLEAGLLNWSQMTPPEFRDTDAKYLSEVYHTGLHNAREKQYYRKDGSRIWVLVGAAMTDAEGTEGIAWVLDITDRKQAEQARRESEERLKLATEATGYGTFDYQPQTGELMWSAAAKKHFGLRPDAHVDYDVFLKGLHPDDRERVSNLVRRSLQPDSGGFYRTEYRTIGIEDGKLRWLSATGRVSFDTSGRPVRFIGATVDITERKKREEALQESQSRMNAVLDSLPVAVWVADPNGHIVQVNRGAHEMFGEAPLLPLDAYKEYRAWWPDTGKQLESHDWALAKAILNGESTLDELIEIETFDGKRKFVRNFGFPVRGLNGENYGAAAVMEDITERRRAEEALRASEQRFRAVAENIPQMIWVADARSTVLYLSPKWLEYTGTTEEQNANPWADAIHPEDRERAVEAWEHAVHTRTAYEAEYRLRRHDGEYRWHLAKAVPITVNGNEDLWFGTTTDVQEQKVAQEALVRTEKLASVGRMAATIAHEINNPLETITNILYLISRDVGLSPKSAKQLALAEEELERVSHLTKQTLAFYRESGKRAEVDVGDVIEKVVAIFNSRAKGRSVDLTYQRRPHGSMWGSSGELNQIVSNLVANALDATEADDSIIVRTSAQKTRDGRDAIRITVADTGSGMDVEVARRMFEPFYTTKKDFGTGLGMWITREIVAKHNGRIQVRTRKGRGTVTSILLPAGIRRRQSAA